MTKKLIVPKGILFSEKNSWTSYPYSSSGNMVTTPTERNKETPLGLCPSDVLVQAMSFLHGTHYRYIATSCKLLLNAYVATKTEASSGHPNYEPILTNKKTTSFRVVVSSIRNVQLFETDTRSAAIETRRLHDLPSTYYFDHDDRYTSYKFWRRAARHGNIETLSYVLRSSDVIFCRGKKRAIIWAMEGNQRIDVIRLLIKKFKFCPLTFAVAARLGRLDVLQSLRNTRNFDSRTCTEAAKNGNFDVLLWARGEGCPWTEETHLYAMRGDDERIKKYVVEEGCPAYSPEMFKRENAYLSSPKRRRW